MGCGYIGGWAVSILDDYGNVSNWKPWFGRWSRSPRSRQRWFSCRRRTSRCLRSGDRTLWQIANASPRSVSAVVLAQLAVVATLGAACGTLVESVTYAPLFPRVFSSPFYQPIDQVVLEVGLADAHGVACGAAVSSSED